MGVLHKYKSCPDSFIMFICGTTCVSIQKNEFVAKMRNMGCKGSTVCALFDRPAKSQELSYKMYLNLFLP